MRDTRLGVLGLGGPGLALCDRAAEAGVSLTCYDPEARYDALGLDGIVAGGAEEVAAASANLIVALSGDEAVRSTILRGGGLLELAAPGTVVVVPGT
jgi:3-hydroxyisobutyrate dehydrogenase-like beta-hydroxyacid dehydrogenase